MNPPFSPVNKKWIRPSLFILLSLVIIFLLSTITLSYLYVKDHRQRDLLEGQAQETRKHLEQLHLSLARGDLKKAFTELAQAQKNMVDASASVEATAPEPMIKQKEISTPPVTAPSVAVSASTAPPAPQPRLPVQAVATKTPPASAAALVIPEGKSPYPFILADSNDYLLLCEKDQKTLHLFRYTKQQFSLVKSFACIVGANGLDKRKEGDLATPVGNYFTLRFIQDQALPEKYGFGAFALNYPNFLDRKARKDGTGIWLHGHTPGKSLGEEELQNTSGCIAVSNDDLKELKGYIKASGTPVVVVNRIQLAPSTQQRLLADELSKFMKSWGKAWESGKTDLFMRHYSTDFINADGMNYQSFKRQKESVNKGKKFIQVKVDDMAILLPQEKGGQIAVVRFTQRYHSNNFDNESRKIFYMKKGQSGWQIIGESRL